MEAQGYTPTIPINDLRYTEPYEYSFAEAVKRGETEAYFQSCNMDYECAEDIYKLFSDNRSNRESTEILLMKHSKERAERVVAAIVNDAPSNRYADHKEWAAKVGSRTSDPVLPSFDFDIFKRIESYGHVLNLFIDEFRKAADSMKQAIFTVVGNDGKSISKSGWALPKEFAPPQAPQKSWDTASSIKDRMAAAEQLANEHNRNNAKQTRKTNRNNSHDL